MRKPMHTNEQVLHVFDLFENTELTLQQIANTVGVSYDVVWKIISQKYTPEARLRRKQQSYKNSRIGELNPSFNKRGKDAFRYIGGRVADGKGYIMVTKPEWYTGRPGSKYVFEHTAVMCVALGLAELPAGFVVHHIDGDKTNNDLANLALLTNAAHSRLHSLERVTTISQESRD